MIISNTVLWLRVGRMVSSDPSIPAGCIELVLRKKNQGAI